MIHDFARSLAMSSGQVDAPWWRDVYTQAFPTLTEMVSVRDDGWAQRGGIDRLLILRDGTTLNVDEKVREKVWPDFCLEYWSDYNHRAPGWIVKELTCDYLAYAFIPSATCHLLPFQTLKRAFRENYRVWRDAADETLRARREHPDWTREQIAAVNGFDLRIVKNRDKRTGRRWETHSLYVPIGVVKDAMCDAMTVRWSISNAAA